jgi:hypothetical protein
MVARPQSFSIDLSRINVRDTVKNIGKGLGSISPEYGYSWYAGF